MESAVIHITYDGFINNYIPKISSEYHWQSSPLQIYPLESLVEYLILPTPILRADYHFIVYLKEGQYKQQVGLAEYNITGPSILFVPEGALFSILSLPKQVISGFFILLENKVITSLMNDIAITELLDIESNISLTSRSNDWIHSVCSLLYQEMCATLPNRHVANGLLLALLHQLIALNGGKRLKSRQDEIATSFRHLTIEYSKNQKTVAFYASTLGVSKNYLNRCVKAVYGKSCKQLIRETVIRQSQLLMLETAKSISEIAFEMGFENPSYFTRVFKKITGQAPSEFRKLILQGLS